MTLQAGWRHYEDGSMSESKTVVFQVGDEVHIPVEEMVRTEDSYGSHHCRYTSVDGSVVSVGVTLIAVWVESFRNMWFLQPGQVFCREDGALEDLIKQANYREQNKLTDEDYRKFVEVYVKD